MCRRTKNVMFEYLEYIKRKQNVQTSKTLPKPNLPESLALQYTRCTRGRSRSDQTRGRSDFDSVAVPEVKKIQDSLDS